MVMAWPKFFMFYLQCTVYSQDLHSDIWLLTLATSAVNNSLIFGNGWRMTANMYIISIEKNILLDRPSGHAREHIIIQNNVIIHWWCMGLDMFILSFTWIITFTLESFWVHNHCQGWWNHGLCVVCAAEVLDEKVREV